MLNRIPLLITILVIVFLITSLLSFIAMENVVTPEKAGVEKSDNSNAQIDMNKPPKTANAAVVIDIVKPNEKIKN